MDKTFTPSINGNIIKKVGSVDIKKLIQPLLSGHSGNLSADSEIEYVVSDRVIKGLMIKLDLLRLEIMN
ncbi:MAG: hypothetical protein U9N53_03930 [Bacteroidota bacterium]|nr:hypothetical protein [Bacteroidota bacterium]